MPTPVKLSPARQPRILTWRRIVFGLAVAVFADGLQFVTGPLGWIGGDQVIDVIAMLLTVWALGFHLLLLPTFVMELIPGVDELPTWTACVIAVIVLRKRAQRAAERESAAGRIAVPPQADPQRRSLQ
jgi:hypothetical protein